MNKPSDEVLNFIQSHFRYNGETGDLFRLNRQTGQWCKFNPAMRYSEKTGEWDLRSRVTIRLGGNCICIFPYHICWYLYYDSWPDKSIDHIDRDVTNNKIANLRLANRAQQGLNRGYSINSKYLPGVFITRSRINPFSAQIRYNTENINLGSFPTEVDAHRAYRKAYKDLYDEELPLTTYEHKAKPKENTNVQDATQNPNYYRYVEQDTRIK